MLQSESVQVSSKFFILFDFSCYTQATVSSVLMNLESKAIVTEDIGRQILTYGVRKSPSEFIADVEKVTAADLQACATELLKSPLTMSSIGNIAQVPAYEVVAKKLK